MTNYSGVPRPFGVTDARRRQEEETRRREQATSARNTSSTTVGSGGRLDVDGGDLTVQNGGNASVKDGGAFRVEGGGSMEIVDDGEVRITGGVYDSLTDGVKVAQVALRTEEITHENVAWTTRRPGIFFSTDGVEGANIHSFQGGDANVVSGVTPVTSGPLVGPDINQSSTVYVAPDNSALTASAFYKTGADMTDSRAQCMVLIAPDSMFLQLYHNNTGEAGSIRVSLEDPVMRIKGRNGVDVSGPFTVDGQPVGGSVTSVAGKTGAVVLVKGDMGLGNVDNTSDAAKPVSTATQTALNGKAASTHTHTTAQVTGLDTALAGKASTAAATSSTAGLMPATDKSKLDNATPSPTPNRLVYRDVWGRAQIEDPVSGTDIVNYQSMMTALNRGDEVKLGLAAGWSDYTGGGGFKNGLWVMIQGTDLIVRGMVKGGAVGSVIAILPVGMVPEYAAIYPAVAVNAPAAVNVIPPESAIKYVFGTAAPSFLNFTMKIPMH